MEQPYPGYRPQEQYATAYPTQSSGPVMSKALSMRIAALNDAVSRGRGVGKRKKYNVDDHVTLSGYPRESGDYTSIMDDQYSPGMNTAARDFLRGFDPMPIDPRFYPQDQPSGRQGDGSALKGFLRRR